MTKRLLALTAVGILAWAVAAWDGLAASDATAGAANVMTAASAAPPAQPEPGPAQAAEHSRRLSAAEINRIRFLELTTYGSRDPDDLDLDRVRVVVPRNVAEDFYRDMEGRPRFEGRDGRQRFMKLSPERKLAEIAYYTSGTPSTASKYIDKVSIRTDPQVMLDFRKHVLPVVLRGCATAKCHGGVDADKTGLRMFDDPKRGDDSVYTNFLLLDEYEVTQKVGAESQKYFMIDRARPGESLLLAWLVAPELTEIRVQHPGKTPIEPVFRETQQPAYEAIREWIRTLRHPHPEYGVRLSRGSASQPAGQPVGDD